MALILSCLALGSLAFIAWLTIDGLRAIFRRRRAERAKRPLTLLVVERREVAGELLCLTLRHPQGKRLPAFAAGQHLLLSAPAGRNDKPVQRAYSLANWSSQPDCYELGIKREAQGVMSQWLWHHLKPGSTLQSTPPQGHFIVDASADALILIGGGIGITPLRAMLHEALAGGRAVILFHAARTGDLLLYREEFAALATTHERFTYRPSLSRPAADWTGERGRLDAGRIVAATAQPERADFFLCAGNEMMAALRQEMIALGIAEARIHSEAFGAATGAGQSGLRLAVNCSGTAKTVLTAGEPTILATLEANDIALASECRAGSCGQCVTQLAAGEVDWLVKPEFAVGPQQFLPCVCAARCDLSISLP